MDKLKEQSVDVRTVRKQTDKPKSGPVYEAKRIIATLYKIAIKRKKDKPGCIHKWIARISVE